MRKVKRVTEAHRERERVQLSKRDVERRIAGILSWLRAHRASDPEWDAKVREMHALEIRLENIGVPTRQRGDVVGDDIRIINV